MRATSFNEIITENKTINPAQYSQIFLINLGDTPATVDDNIPLAPGASYSFANDPGVIINQATNIRFLGGGTEPKILCLTIYYEK